VKLVHPNIGAVGVSCTSRVACFGAGFRARDARFLETGIWDVWVGVFFLLHKAGRNQQQSATTNKGHTAPHQMKITRVQL